MTKYAKCSVCGYTIKISDDKDAGDFICPTDGIALVAAAAPDYIEDHAEGIALESLVSDPDLPVAGQLYYNSIVKKMFVYIP